MMLINSLYSKIIIIIWLEPSDIKLLFMPCRLRMWQGMKPYGKAPGQIVEVLQVTAGIVMIRFAEIGIISGSCPGQLNGINSPIVKFLAENFLIPRRYPEYQGKPGCPDEKSFFSHPHPQESLLILQRIDVSF